MRAVARLLVFVATLCVVLPAGALPARYYCNWMGQSMTSCCCRGHDTEVERARDDRLRRTNCCELLPASDATLPVTRELSVSVDAAVFVERSRVQLPDAAGACAAASVPAQARAPPRVGQALYLSHCSFLI